MVEGDHELSVPPGLACAEITRLAPSSLPAAPVEISSPPHLANAYRFYLWLKEQTFDLVSLPEHGGWGFYCLLARHQGLAFPHTKFWIRSEGPSLWRREQMRQWVEHPFELEIDFMERRVVELADAITYSRPQIAEWLRRQGWLSQAAWAGEECVLPAAEEIPQRAGIGDVASSPLVSVCLAHHNRPRLLAQALRSIDRQDYSPFEVVLVDDGSTEPAALAALSELERDFARRGWKLIRQPNLYAGAAYNTAARHARGEYLLFMDDDNYAKPGEISTLVRAALHSGADILAPLLDVFAGDREPTPDLQPLRRTLFVGGEAVAGLFRNCFGDTNALVRRETYLALGGCTEDVGVPYEDWEFYSKASLQGYRIEVVPEALVWYRLSPEGITGTTSPFSGHHRRFRPYRHAGPPAMRELAHLSYGLKLRGDRFGIELKEQREAAEKEIRQLREELRLHQEILRSFPHKMASRLERAALPHPRLRRMLTALLGAFLPDWRG